MSEKEQETISENAKRFMEWLESLRPFELLDLLMNCGYLLGKTITPPEVDDGQSEVSQSVEQSENA